jgi:hypothetical protein
MSYSISTLLTRNLHDVFGENDPARRRAAIDEIYRRLRVLPAWGRLPWSQRDRSRRGRDQGYSPWLSISANRRARGIGQRRADKGRQAEARRADPFRARNSIRQRSLPERTKISFDKFLFVPPSCECREWFKDTPPSAPISNIAVLRLDGDMYESTMDALGSLYSKVSPGGFVTVDDYGIPEDVADQP